MTDNKKIANMVWKFLTHAYGQEAMPGYDQNDANIIEAVRSKDKKYVETLINTFQNAIDTKTDEQLETFLFDEFQCEQQPFLEYGGPFRDVRHMFTHIISVLSERLK